VAEEKHPARINCVLIAGGKYHDIDFARLELLKLLAEDERVRVRVFEDYENIEAIKKADIFISYTCDVVPSLSAQEALRNWVEAGGRWYGLHGTNSILRPQPSGLWAAPRWAPLHMETLGSQFIAHPPIAPYLYLMETHGKLEVLLETEFGGDGTGFVEHKWEKQKHPVFYIHTLGKGAVLYLTLGHCRGHYDLQPLADWWPSVDRCAWDLPVYYTMLRRGIEWIKDRP
jgi:uncharacterized protein